MASIYDLFFVGLFISIFRINFGGVDIFPSILGYFIVLNAALKLDKGFNIKSSKEVKLYSVLLILQFPLAFLLRDIFGQGPGIYIFVGLVDTLLHVGLLASIFQGAEDLYRRYGVDWLGEVFGHKQKGVFILSILPTLSLFTIFMGPHLFGTWLYIISNLIFILYNLSGLHTLKKDLYYTEIEKI